LLLLVLEDIGFVTQSSFCFSVANEVTEKLAVVGFNTNMISYLTTQLHMPLTKAANTVTNLGGTASLTPLLGAFIADSFAGRFWTVTVASIIYQIVEHLSLFLMCIIFT
jgi:peptide/histidine transporter 3/4